MKEKSNLSALKKVLFFKITRYSIASLIIGFAINIAGGYISDFLKLPIWFDTVGTIMVAIQFGPIAGSLVGFSSSILMHFVKGIPLPYTVIGVLVGVIIGLLFPRKRSEDALAIVSLAMLMALISSFISIPINMKYSMGYPGNIWGDALYDMLSRSVTNMHVVTFASEMFVDIPDRIISMGTALMLMKLTRKFIKGVKSGKHTSSAITILIISALVLSQGMNVQAEDFSTDDFEVETYGGEEGIASTQVNAVAQTSDGYLWVGTYSGLYRYDGVNFESVEIDDNIKNVMSLYQDSKGRLWVGTNDSGVFCYDFTTGETVSYNSKSGLDADSIRSICEDTKGNIYLGTLLSVSQITPSGEVKTYSEWHDIQYACSFAPLEDGSVVGVSGYGTLFHMDNDILLDELEHDGNDELTFREVAYHDGELVVGTSADVVEVYSVKDGKFTKKQSITLDGIGYINDLCYDDYYGGFFLCCENGMGFLDRESGRTYEFNKSILKGEVSSVCVDMQKNIWFSSSKQGLIKYSKTIFENITLKAGVKEDVVNALYLDGTELYMGGDNGLKLMDISTGFELRKSFMEETDNIRVRHIMKDSKGNMWISTHGEEGLIKVDKDGNTKSFNEKTAGTLGSKFRLTMELSDGRILASTNIGLSFIENDKVVATIGQNNGMNNQRILTLMEREDGSILAGSDGDGIYILKNDRIVGHIGESEGLETAVVLRIVKCSGGYIYVTSNSLYYDNGVDKVRRLEHFSYSNNYDVMVKDGKCWITSSAGLFVVDEEDLIADNEEYDYTLLDSSWGLKDSFTANSWNLIKDDDLYLCSIDGVRKVSTTEYREMNNDYQIHLKRVITSEGEVNEVDGRCVIPPSSGRIDFEIAVNNYTLSNPVVDYYLEERPWEGNICYQDDIIPLTFTNLPGGTYHLHIAVYNMDTYEYDKEVVIEIVKEKAMYEKLYFILYLWMVGGFLAFYIIWLFYSINKKSQSIRGLQKEMTTDPMTGILNKAGCHKTLKEVCEKDTGVLMMIDLDSFKLVNDLYGHDMGDKVLIRFAELLQEGVKEGDVAGRLGGDEFVGFLKGTLEEEDVEKFTVFMNKEIVKSAKQFMGEDMNIPLGTSIGAVRVPTEGRDFEELFKLADKALYVVKQNGKHGYSFYQSKGNKPEDEEGNTDKNNLGQIKKIISERNEGKGAYSVSFDRLQVLYKYINRNTKVSGHATGIARLYIERKSGAVVSDEIRDIFESHLITNLHKNDILSAYSGNFYILFSDDGEGGFEKRVTSLISGWKESGDYEDYEVKYEVEPVG